MGTGCLDALGGKGPELPAVEQDVGGRAFQVASFDHCRLRAHRHQVAGGVSGVVQRLNGSSGQDLRLRCVGCDHLGQRYQKGPQRPHRLLLKQLVASLGYHDRVNHQPAQAVLLNLLGDGHDNGGARQHAGLDRVGADVRDDRVYLRADQRRWQLQRFGNPEGILRGDGGENRGAVHAKSGKGFQVRLDARAAARV